MVATGDSIFLESAENEFLLAQDPIERQRHDSFTFHEPPEFRIKQDVAPHTTQLSRSTTYLILGGIVACFVIQYQSSQLAVQLPSIASDLGALDQASWVVTPYLLCDIAGPSIFVQLSKVIGRRTVLIWCIASFGFGSALCSLGPTLWAVATARFLAGLGGSGVFTLVTTIMSDAIPLQQRGLYQSYINVANMCGIGLGVTLGGLLLDALGWRLSFIVQVVPTLASLLLVSVGTDVPDSLDLSQSTQYQHKLSGIDFAGTASFLCAGFALLLCVDIGGRFGWISALAVIAALLTILTGTAFVYIECRVATQPLVPLDLTLDSNFYPFFLAGFCQQAAWTGNAYQLPRYLKIVDGMTGTQIAARLLAAPFFNTLGSFIAGFYMRWTARYKALTIVGFVLTSISDTCIFLGALLGSTPGIVLSYISSNLFSGIPVNSLMIGQISHAAYDQHATTTAVYTTYRAVGNAFGVAISFAVSNTSLRTALDRTLDPDIAARMRNSLDFAGLAPDIVETIRTMYQSAITAAVSVNVVLAVLALSMSVLIREKSLAVNMVVGS